MKRDDFPAFFTNPYNSLLFFSFVTASPCPQSCHQGVGTSPTGGNWTSRMTSLECLWSCHVDSCQFEGLPSCDIHVTAGGHPEWGCLKANKSLLAFISDILCIINLYIYSINLCIYRSVHPSIPFHSIPFHPIPSHPIPSHPSIYPCIIYRIIEN